MHNVHLILMTNFLKLYFLFTTSFDSYGSRTEKIIEPPISYEKKYMKVSVVVK